MFALNFETVPQPFGDSVAGVIDQKRLAATSAPDQRVATCCLRQETYGAAVREVYYTESCFTASQDVRTSQSVSANVLHTFLFVVLASSLAAVALIRSSADPVLAYVPTLVGAVQLCRACFYEVFEDEVHQTIVASRLFKRGEKVAIGASGVFQCLLHICIVANLF